jgi:hypothetical protein
VTAQVTEQVEQCQWATSDDPPHQLKTTTEQTFLASRSRHQTTVFNTAAMPSTTGQEQQGTLELQQKKKGAGPVECLGLTFENDQARREHFTALLKEKLQDPEFRKIPGFPQGSDEAILRMSDPPYYTACPNPFFLEIIQDRENSEEFQNQPFAIDVSEGKTGAFYNAHTYHTKVPPTAIAKYLLWFTKPGDVVLDCFGGSGMTGVAARLCATNDKSLRHTINKYWEEMGLEKPEWGARTALVNDISPAATFISSVQATPVDKERLKDDIDTALKLAQEELGWLYKTAHNGWSSGERDPSKPAPSSVGDDGIDDLLTAWDLRKLELLGKGLNQLQGDCSKVDQQITLHRQAEQGVKYLVMRRLELIVGIQGFC